MNWWKHIPGHINPNIIQIGTFQLRYYGVMYIVAFILIYFLVLFRLKNERFNFTKEIIQNYLGWVLLGVMIGGRLGYVLFYDLNFFLANPLKIICPFEITKMGINYTGIFGMSYHGGLVGVILVSILFSNKYKINLWQLADLLSPTIPLGYTFGRIGNFINGELYGRVTTVPWAMYFPLDLTHQLRHPSQLYEAFFEGIFLFLILWSLRKTKVFDGFLFCLYLIGYGIGRFFIEFGREPDSQLGFILGPFTMGQILCVCMIFIGVFIIIIKKEHITKQSR